MTIALTVIAFLSTILFIFVRPQVNEAIPATIGAAVVILSGSVSFADLGVILTTVGGAATTIISTIVMAIVLESFGFFQWVAERLTEKAKGSGIRLFWYTNLLCFLMTLFVNNDGSILITTPILIMILQKFGLNHNQKIPYLLSGALVATASSAPVGVSNIVNLIALKIVGMDLYMYTAMMFVPATTALLLMVLIIFLLSYKILPRQLPFFRLDFSSHPNDRNHPLQTPNPFDPHFMRNIIIFVFSVRIGLFVASYFHFPVPLAAVIGSLILLTWRWIHLKIPPTDIVRKTPWYILIFAFGMYVIVYGLQNIGFTQWLMYMLHPLVNQNLHYASIMIGLVVSAMSDLFNNHPALMVGTMTLINMGLDPLTLKVTYLATVIGSDIGSLLLPIGTLASIMWMHILRKHQINITWGEYLKVTVIAIPLTVIFTLVFLPYWISWLF